MSQSTENDATGCTWTKCRTARGLPGCFAWCKCRCHVRAPKTEAQEDAGLHDHRLFLEVLGLIGQAQDVEGLAAAVRQALTPDLRVIPPGEGVDR